MAAKIPMITTTIRSSIRVKPLRFIRQPPRRGKSRTLRTKTPVLISASNMPPEAYIAYLAAAQEDSPFDVAELDPPDYPLTPAFCEALGRKIGRASCRERERGGEIPAAQKRKRVGPLRQLDALRLGFLVGRRQRRRPDANGGGL